jgi:ubiquinol-cytochrome c reductase cytochrome b subunit
MWGEMLPKMTNDLTFGKLYKSFIDQHELVFFPLAMSSPHIRALKRIGPHNKEILYLFIGSLLGDSYLERHGSGYRFCFYQESSNKAYLYWLHNFVVNAGYTNPEIPKIQTRLGSNINNHNLRQVLRFKTWTYYSFKWIHDGFYKLDSNGKLIKYINPLIIEEYLSPLALAIWIMDDGCRSGKGLKISTNSFTYDECNYLKIFLMNRYNLTVSIHKTIILNQYVLYIHTGSINILLKLIKPYLHPSMYYKLNISKKTK